MLSGSRLRKRLDRLFCHLDDFQLQSIEMVGRNPIPGVTFQKEMKVKRQPQLVKLPVLPSDHFGLLLKLLPRLWLWQFTVQIFVARDSLSHFWVTDPREGFLSAVGCKYRNMYSAFMSLAISVINSKALPIFIKMPPISIYITCICGNYYVKKYLGLFFV